MNRSWIRVAGLILLVLVLTAAAAVGGYAVTRSVSDASAQPKPSPTVSLPAGVRGATRAPASQPAPPGASPAPGAVAAALRPDLHVPDLGGRLRAEVVDLTSGHTLFTQGATAPAAPASTAKLLTASALLAVRSPDYRIPTTVRAGAPGTVVLVGGGDPTLTGAAAGKPGPYPHAARLSDLAAQLKSHHVPVRRIVVDDALFTGPTISPAWAPEDVPSGYASAITPVMSDGGRIAPDSEFRGADPDLVAGQELATLLGTPHIPVVRSHAASHGRVLATVYSAPLATIIGQMLQESDNVIAECMARQVALARHMTPSFTGAAAAIRAELRSLGVNVGSGMVDGSGLAASDRLSAQTLTRVLRLITVSGPPQLHDIVAALPVAGWSGTLETRYLAGSTKAGAGLVRAKTGTLTGVSSLAGVVHDRGGRLLAFAFIADRAPSTPLADAALDGLATDLVRCVCR